MPANKIIVGASAVPGQYTLPQILSLFSRTYPGNQLELKEGDSMEVVRMVREGQVEIGFATISNQETIKKSVGAALGISIISGAAVEDYVKQGSLLCFSLGAEEVYRKLYIVWSKNHKPGKSARQFIQFVRELYAYL